MEYRKYVQEEKKERRAEVVKAAAELFLEEGIDAVRMTDIADACECGVASVYRYFGNKTVLAVAAGEYLWGGIRPLFEQSTPGYDELSGYGRLQVLFHVFIRLYDEQRSFLKFIHDFDALMLREKPDVKSMEGYEKAVLSFFPLFREAYELGVSDGSVREIADFETYYYSATHLLLFSCQKFAIGSILSIDSEERRHEELVMMAEMALRYVRGAEK